MPKRNTTVTALQALALLNNALVVRQAAVQLGQNGNFVFVVRDNDTAEARPVVTKRTFEGMSVIQSGLAAGERVVIDGQLRLSNGSRVEIRTPAPAAPAGKTS